MSQGKQDPEGHERCPLGLRQPHPSEVQVRGGEAGTWLSCHRPPLLAPKEAYGVACAADFDIFLFLRVLPGARLGRTHSF